MRRAMLKTLAAAKERLGDPQALVLSASRTRGMGTRAILLMAGHPGEDCTQVLNQRGAHGAAWRLGRVFDTRIMLSSVDGGEDNFCELLAVR